MYNVTHSQLDINARNFYSLDIHRIDFEVSTIYKV